MRILIKLRLSETIALISPTVKITISSTKGISYSEPIKKGKQIFEVQFEDQIVHENFVGHDVNLVKLDENENVSELAEKKPISNIDSPLSINVSSAIW